MLSLVEDCRDENATHTLKQMFPLKSFAAALVFEFASAYFGKSSN
jgi:hypothetical protein